MQVDSNEFYSNLKQINNTNEDDTISSSDGSFMPPVLSSYAKELLSDLPIEKQQQQQDVKIVTASNSNQLRQKMGLPMTDGTSTRTNNYIYNEQQEQPPNDVIENDGGETYMPAWTRFNSASPNDTPNNKENDQHNYNTTTNGGGGFSTPGLTTTKPSSSKELTGLKSGSRVKRFVPKGSGLGPPKRTVRHSNEGISTNTAGSDDYNDNNNNHKSSSKIRFANDDQEIPPKDYSGSSGGGGGSNSSSSYQSFGSSGNNPHQDEKMQQPMVESREALSQLSPNLSAPRSTRFQGAKTPPPKMENLVSSERQQPTNSKNTKSTIHVNNKPYQKLEMIGRGGSSKVYKVQTNPGSKVMAVKKVTFDDADDSVIQGFKGEIDLLKKLRDEERVVRLIDYEMLDMTVYVVMEIGEIDLAHVLTARLNQPLDISFVRYYSIEMLKCVAAVHRHGIVHSDLKPANFLLVKGMLKIIDFGIANVVPEYTANVHRDNQIGTPNYMAPEALLDSNNSNGGESNTDPTFKVGRPSDVWSIGCIIYQMVYGKPPYGNYSGPQRMLAIMNPKVQIQYPKHGLGQVKVPREAIECIRGCLERDPTTRSTIDQTLCGSFLNPQAVDRHFIKTLIDHAVQYGIERNEPVKGQELDLLTDDVWRKIQALNM